MIKRDVPDRIPQVKKQINRRKLADCQLLHIDACYEVEGNTVFTTDDSDASDENSKHIGLFTT